MDTIWRSQRVQHPPIQQTGPFGAANLCARAVMTMKLRIESDLDRAVLFLLENLVGVRRLR
jgi:hypothetical protein